MRPGDVNEERSGAETGKVLVLMYPVKMFIAPLHRLFTFPSVVSSSEGTEKESWTESLYERRNYRGIRHTANEPNVPLPGHLQAY